MTLCIYANYIQLIKYKFLEKATKLMTVQNLKEAFEESCLFIDQSQ